MSNLHVRVTELEAEVERLRAVLKEVDYQANWIPRTNQWKSHAVTAGRPPNADNACRRIREIVRVTLGTGGDTP